MTKCYDNAMTIIADRGWDFRNAVIEDARNWVADCEWEDETDSLSDKQILRGIEKHYEGGLIAFLRDGTYI